MKFTPPHLSNSYIQGYHLELLLMIRNLEDIKNRVKPILQKYGIKKAGIFGSAARGAVKPNDIDILVKIDRKISLLEFISIQQEIEDELGIKVDLVEYSAIKPALKDDILDEEVPVIGANAKRRYTFKISSKALATSKNFSME